MSRSLKRIICTCAVDKAVVTLRRERAIPFERTRFRAQATGKPRWHLLYTGRRQQVNDSGGSLYTTRRLQWTGCHAPGSGSPERPGRSSNDRQVAAVAEVHEVVVQLAELICTEGVTSGTPLATDARSPNHAPCSVMLAAPLGTLVGVTEVSPRPGCGQYAEKSCHACKPEIHEGCRFDFG